MQCSRAMVVGVLIAVAGMAPGWSVQAAELTHFAIMGVRLHMSAQEVLGAALRSGAGR